MSRATRNTGKTDGRRQWETYCKVRRRPIAALGAGPGVSPPAAARGRRAACWPGASAADRVLISLFFFSPAAVGPLGWLVGLGRWLLVGSVVQRAPLRVDGKG